jgi:hypothetical protein
MDLSRIPPVRGDQLAPGPCPQGDPCRPDRPGPRQATTSGAVGRPPGIRSGIGGAAAAVLGGAGWADRQTAAPVEPAVLVQLRPDGLHGGTGGECRRRGRSFSKATESEADDRHREPAGGCRRLSIGEGDHVRGLAQVLRRLKSQVDALRRLRHHHRVRDALRGRGRYREPPDTNWRLLDVLEVANGGDGATPVASGCLTWPGRSHF